METGTYDIFAFLSAASCGSGKFNWYGFIIAVGIVICVIGAYFAACSRGIEGDIVIDIIIFCLPLAIIGARVYYVIFDIVNGGHWTFTRFIGIEENGLQGLAIYGGLIGALVGAVLLVLWKRRKKNPEDKRITFMQLADLGFTFIILGQAIGRWGNFANQEAYGYRITDPSMQWFPLAVHIVKPNLGVDGYFYATFFYESMWNLVGFGLMLFFYCGKYKSFDGFNLAFYCIYYGIGRAWIEGLRSDSLWLVPPTVAGSNGTPDVGGIRVSQLLSILLIVYGVVYIVVHIVRAKQAGKKIFLFVDRAKLCDDYFEYDKTKLAHPMPDITPLFGKKKSKSDDIVIDNNGVAIRQTAEDNAEDTAGETAEQTVAPDKDSETKQRSRPNGAEEQYEDRWDE